MSDNAPAVNTDIDVVSFEQSDGRSVRIFITEGLGIGIEVSGLCIVKAAAEWHKLALPDGPPKPQPSEPHCKTCGGEMVFAGYCGTSENVDEIYRCLKCDPPALSVSAGPSADGGG